MSYKLPDSVVKAIGTSQANKSSTETSCSTVESTPSSTVESTPSSTTTIEMGSEEEEDCHFIFLLMEIFHENAGGPNVRLVSNW